MVAGCLFLVSSVLCLPPVLSVPFTYHNIHIVCGLLWPHRSHLLFSFIFFLIFSFFLILVFYSFPFDARCHVLLFWYSASKRVRLRVASIWFPAMSGLIWATPVSILAAYPMKHCTSSKHDTALCIGLCRLDSRRRSSSGQCTFCEYVCNSGGKLSREIIVTTRKKGCFD